MIGFVMQIQNYFVNGPPLSFVNCHGESKLEQKWVLNLYFWVRLDGRLIVEIVFLWLFYLLISRKECHFILHDSTCIFHQCRCMVIFHCGNSDTRYFFLLCLDNCARHLRPEETARRQRVTLMEFICRYSCSYDLYLIFWSCCDLNLSTLERAESSPEKS
jgi:hypothetical protein